VSLAFLALSVSCTHQSRTKGRRVEWASSKVLSTHKPLIITALSSPSAVFKFDDYQPMLWFLPAISGGRIAAARRVHRSLGGLMLKSRDLRSI
jgi:hypothetical protein